MPLLSHLIIATTGTLPHITKQIRTWIERNGGTHTTSITKSTTHLIASKESYKLSCRKGKTTPTAAIARTGPTDPAIAAIAQATRLGLPIISLDWLEDTLRARRKLSTKMYEWDFVRREKKRKREVERVGERVDSVMFREGVVSSIQGIHGIDSYHIYRDASGYDYKISLVRSAITAESAGYARYQLVLLESHGKPWVYWCVAVYKPAFTSTRQNESESEKEGEKEEEVEGVEEKHKNGQGKDINEGQEGEGKKGTSVMQDPRAQHLLSLLSPSFPSPSPSPSSSSSTQTYNLTPPATPFDRAFTAFRQAFQDLTLLPWENRFNDTPTRALQMQLARETGVEPFIWGRPGWGLPVGVMPQADLSEFTGGGYGKGGAYVRGSSNLAFIHEPLTPRGMFGATILREHRDAQLAQVARVHDDDDETGKRECGAEAKKQRQGKAKNARSGLRRARISASGGRDGRGFVDPGVAHLLGKAKGMGKYE